MAKYNLTVRSFSRQFARIPPPSGAFRAEVGTLALWFGERFVKNSPTVWMIRAVEELFWPIAATNATL